MSRPADIPSDVWAAAVAAERKRTAVELGWPEKDVPIDPDYVEPIARAILHERQICALGLDCPSGTFAPPIGFREVVGKHLDDVDGEGSLVFRGHTRAQWDRFFQEMLRPYAAAIRRGSA